MRRPTSHSAGRPRDGCLEVEKPCATAAPLAPRRRCRLYAVRRRAATAWSSCKRLCLRLDVSWSACFFLLLVVVGVVTASVTQTLICNSLFESLRDLHHLRVTDKVGEISLITRLPLQVARTLLGLHLQSPPSMESPSTLALLCATLKAVADLRYSSVLLFSMQESTAAGCVMGLTGNPLSVTMGGYYSIDHMVNHSYMIDPLTDEVVQPRQVLEDWPLIRRSLSVSLSDLYGASPLLTLAKQYYSRRIETVDPQQFWMIPRYLPHVFIYTLPVGMVARGTTLREGQYADDFVQVVFHGSRLLNSYEETKRSSDFSAAAFVNVSLTDKHPKIYANNWGQESVSDIYSFAPSSALKPNYLLTSNISDPLMAAAVKHVDFKAMQTIGYNRSVTFQYRGAPAIVTALTYETQEGFVVPLVVVSGQSFVTPPYRYIFIACNVAIAAAIVAFTALFWWFVHHEYSVPLVRMAELLRGSLATGKRALLTTSRTACVQLRESAALIRVFNDFTRQLRHIDAFIPRDIRERLLRRRGTDTPSERSRTSSLHLSDIVVQQQRRRRRLEQHHLSIVYLTIRADAPEAAAAATVAAVAAAPVAVGGAGRQRRGQRLAAAVELAAHVGSAVNSGPFPSPAALAAFATAVHDLAEHRGGVVRDLAPDRCAVHFSSRVRAHLPPRRRAPTSPSAAAPPAGSTAYDALAMRAHIDGDARDALGFTLALLHWVDRCGADARMPDVRALVDTGVFTCGQYCAERGSEQTLSVALGRDVQRALGGLPAWVGVRAAMTEETAVRVRGGDDSAAEPGVRQVPVEALRTGRTGLDADVIILYEALPGDADDAAWQQYSLCCFDAFELMARGDYAGALCAYRSVATIRDLEPGLLPRSLRREAASSDVTGGAVSTQVERLMRECERRVAAGQRTGYCRDLRSPHCIDAVLRGVQLAPAGRPAWTPPPDVAPVPQRSNPFRVLSRPDTVRTVAVIRTQAGNVRCVLGGKPERVVDNFGAEWKVSRRTMERMPTEAWAAHYVALGSAGSMCIASFLPFRELNPVVAKAIRDAARGPMSGALRSAVPVMDATERQRCAVEELFVGRRRLHHANLVSFSAYSLSMEGGVVTLKDFAPAGTLREVLGRYPALPVATSANFLLCILSALAYLHESGCVHGAVSLDTAMVGADGQCRLRGYFVDHALAQATFLLPCTCYVSPAMARGAAPTPACDMFCYGLLVLESLSGRRPWRWAAVAGTAPPSHQRSAEELDALVAGGGAAFCAAVAEGRVVPAAELLNAATLHRHIGGPVMRLVRRCLSSDPALRPSALDVWWHLYRSVQLAGVPRPRDEDAASRA